METKRIFTEVRCDYYNEDGYWCIDAWINDSDEDGNGRVVGWVDGTSGNIYYKDEDAEYDPLVIEVATKKQEEVRKERHQKMGELGETMVLLSADLFNDIYQKMNEPDYTQLACEIRDLAYKFESDLDWKGQADERDYYMELMAFEEKERENLIDQHCSKWKEVYGAADWLDLDQCQRAYELGGIHKTCLDYTIEGYNNLSDEEKERLSNEGKAWDDKQFYDDFKEWWHSLDNDKRNEIYNQL